MATNTYVAIAPTVTVSGTSTFYVDFISIPQTYTDLLLVTNAASSLTPSVFGCTLKMGNGGVLDTGANYSSTYMYGTGSGTGSGRSITYAGYAFESYSSSLGVSETHIQNYSNTTTYKTWVSRSSAAGSGDLVGAWVGLWRSTNAIDTIRVYAADIGAKYFLPGSTFTLYGIKAVGGDTTPKALGGIVTSDSTYYYHTFLGTSTFTALQTLTADVLVIAGGGSGGASTSAGGGAGGLCYQSGRTITAGAYPAIIGAGGANAIAVGQGYNGANSVFDTITSVGGGGGNYGPYAAGNNGGSGGGGGEGQAAGSATQTNSGGATGYGNAGASGPNSAPYRHGGGGGAGTAGTSGSSTGAGGDGLNTWSSWATVTGTGVSGYYAGGGGGGSNSTTASPGGAGGGGQGSGTSNANGVTNTGSGGGGSGSNGGTNGAGGSGIIIVRYLK